MQVSVAEIVVVVDDDLIQTQTAECLTIYGTCENNYYICIILQLFYVVHSTCTSCQLDFKTLSQAQSAALLIPLVAPSLN